MYTIFIILYLIASLVSCERIPSLEVSSYKLHLTINDETFYNEPYEFKGYAQIKLSIRASYDTDIKMHAAHDFIKIERIFLDDQGMTNFYINQSTDVLTIEGSKDISKNIYGITLYIHYSSRLSTKDMYGLYRTSFKTKDGEKFFALSQLSPNFAKRVFPCFDEPTFKTTYQLYVSYTPGIEIFFDTVGNLVNTTDIIDNDPTLETLLFKTTRKLATYMTGLILSHKGEFSCSDGESITSIGGAYRVCSRSNLEASRNWAVAIGPSLMKQLVNFTNFIYQDKMDLVAVPHLPVPAQENWGLVTMRESNLLLNNDDSSILDKEKIAMTMAFEFAQMWFGNVATPEWWSICYVSKGLATYLQYLITHLVFGEWELNKQILVQVVHPAFEIDSYVDSPPLETVVDSTKEILSKFDRITYFKEIFHPFSTWCHRSPSPNCQPCDVTCLSGPVSSLSAVISRALDERKESSSERQSGPDDHIIFLFIGTFGASLFRMLKEVIAGYENFRKGLEYFLTSFSYRTTQSQGMWNLISAQVNLQGGLLPKGKVLKEVLLNWEKYPGYPLLEVTRDTYKTITIHQKGRFMYSGLDSSYQWYVPVSYTLASSETPFTDTTLNQWLHPNDTFEIKVQSVDEEWVILNTQASGYYRVHYGDMWINISRSIQALNFSGIHELNRAQLLDDLFALGRARIVDYSLVFDFAQYLSNEGSHYAWDAAVNGFGYILRRINDKTYLKAAVLEYIFKLMETVYSTVSWETIDDSDYSYTLKQIDILNGACHFGHAACIEKALAIFERFYNTGNKPHKNVRQLVYCMGMRYAKNTSYWDFLWKVFDMTNTENERNKLLSAFGCTQNENFLKTYLQMSLDETSDIKPQDASAVFTAVYSGSHLGARVAFEFLLENQEKILQRYQDMNCLKSIGLDLAEYLTDINHIDKMKNFFTNRTDTEDEFQPVAKQVLEILDLNQLWIDENLQELYDYFVIDPDQDVTTKAPSKANDYALHFDLLLFTVLYCLINLIQN